MSHLRKNLYYLGFAVEGPREHLSSQTWQMHQASRLFCTGQPRYRWSEAISAPVSSTPGHTELNLGPSKE